MDTAAPVVRVMVPPAQDPMTLQLPPIAPGAVVVIDCQAGDSDYRKLVLASRISETSCGAIACLIGLQRQTGIIIESRSPYWARGEVFPIPAV